MSEHWPVIVVGGGQAGLAMSYCLGERHIEHLVLEKHTSGYAWQQQRWDSFCLVTPNWQCRLPGFPYQGNDPHGFMLRDEVVQYIRDYVAHFQPPLREGVTVTTLQRHGKGFALNTSAGDFTADQVVIATGGYHTPAIPRLAERLPDHICQLHSSVYKNPESLPPGAVLVVGSGQSGAQIAEDLHLAGRQVHLSVGSAPRSPRRYRGKDVVDWLDLMGYYDLPIDEHPQKETIRHRANHYVTGRDGGREIDLRQFAREGMQLHGRLAAVSAAGQISFADDLAANLDQADAVANSIRRTIDTYIEHNHLDAPAEAHYTPVWQPEAHNPPLATEAIASVIWCTGFTANFRWVNLPLFDGGGEPCHERGVTPVRGAYFLGLPWLYTWGSGRFSGIERDAVYLADYIVARQKAPLNVVAIGT